MQGTIVAPGDRLGASSEYLVGPGTYEDLGIIFSSLVGTVHEEEGQNQKRMMTVRSKNQSPVVPKAGDIITGKVQRVQQHQCHVSISCVGQHSLSSDFRGVVRLVDVRATEIDKVVMSDSFRPGDIVRCEVLGLGDLRSYILSTARNDLGVIFAKSASSGQPLVPISWSEMQCPETLMLEKRKLATTAP